MKKTQDPAWAHIPGLPDRAPGMSDTGGRGGAAGTVAAQPILSARELSIGWGRGAQRTVLASGIGFELVRGEVAALVGPNGAGKSTLLRTLVGMQAALSGRVLLDGEDPFGMQPDRRSTRAAYVHVEPVDSGYFTVFDMVAFGRYPYTDARNRLSADDVASVRAALDAVGMAAFAERRYAGLSDGEQQKTQIARAVAQDTPLVVLDEPTAFLDMPSRIEIFDLIARLARRGGKALVVCTHEIDAALRYADELWILDRAHRFETLEPAMAARSGAIGRAFDTDAVRFDPVSRAFAPRAADRVSRTDRASR